MIQKIYDWIDDRVDVTPIWRDIATMKYQNT